MTKRRMPRLNDGWIFECGKCGYIPEVELMLAMFGRAYYDYLNITCEMSAKDVRSARFFLFSNEQYSFKWWLDVAELDLDISYIRKHILKIKEKGINHENRRRITKNTNKLKGIRYSVEFL